MLEHVGRIVAAVGVPVTADLEAGYGDTADDVGRTVARAVELGAVGGNLEDAKASGGLFGIDEAVDRLAAARAAAPRGTFVLNARTDTYFKGTTGDVFAETVERAVRYVEAGADCVFVPGVVEEGTIRRLAAAVPGPLNVVAGLANVIDAPTLFSLGVKRVSLGGSLARAALSILERASRELLESGTRSASSTVRSGTPTCSDASARDHVLCAHGETGRARWPSRPPVVRRWENVPTPVMAGMRRQHVVLLPSWGALFRGRGRGRAYPLMPRRALARSGIGGSKRSSQHELSDLLGRLSHVTPCHPRASPGP
jgi:hypothetical protein